MNDEKALEINRNARACKAAQRAAEQINAALTQGPAADELARLQDALRKVREGGVR